MVETPQDNKVQEVKSDKEAIVEEEKAAAEQQQKEEKKDAEKTEEKVVKKEEKEREPSHLFSLIFPTSTCSNSMTHSLFDRSARV